MMKKEKERGSFIIVGIVLALILSFVKLFIGGGTFLEYGYNKWIFDLVFFIFSGVIIGYIFSEFKGKARLISIMVTVFVLLLLNKILYNLIYSGSEGLSSFYYMGIFYLLTIVLVSLVGWIITYIVYYFLNKRKNVFLITSYMVVWVFGIFLLINDMVENFNLGGPNGNWYIYGDILVLVGAVVLLIYGGTKK